MRMGVPRRLYVAKSCFYDPLVLLANLNSLVRIGKQTQLVIGLLRVRLGPSQVRAKFTFPGSFDRFVNATSPLLQNVKNDGVGREEIRRRFLLFLSRNLIISSLSVMRLLYSSIVLHELHILSIQWYFCEGHLCARLSLECFV